MYIYKKLLIFKWKIMDLIKKKIIRLHNHNNFQPKSLMNTLHKNIQFEKQLNNQRKFIIKIRKSLIEEIKVITNNHKINYHKMKINTCS